MAPTAIPLLARVICPHCWERFPPEDVLWVAEHADLLGDPYLGEHQQARFLPSRFDPDGAALDARGIACREIACPKCRLGLVRGQLEMEPLFLSVLGSSGSGKSYFLGSATWTLRDALPHDFGVSFADADLTTNSLLNQAEERLFLNPEPDRLTPLTDLIDKTVLEGDSYDSVDYGQHVVRYARPFLFSLRPMSHHPAVATSAANLSRMVCLYDNAGEHFQPGQDTARQPVTRHLAISRALLFVFDPTQDQRFRAAAEKAKTGPDGGGRKDRSYRQETILNEAAARIRRHAGLAQTAQHDRPLIVVLSKFDTWSHLLDIEPRPDPWQKVPGSPVAGLYADHIEEVSDRLKVLMRRLCPETVAAADSLSPDVIYIPVTSLGDAIEPLDGTGKPGIRPRSIAPFWAGVPILYALHRVIPGLVRRLKKVGSNGAKI